MSKASKEQSSAWWRWPENKETGHVAWFVILRRLAFLPLMAIGALLYLTGIALSYGYSDARRALREFR